MIPRRVRAMKRLAVILGLLCLIGPSVYGEEPAPGYEPPAETPKLALAGAASPQAVAERALIYLQARGMNWKEERDCASCHHLPMMVWSCAEARAKGYAIDTKAFNEAVAWLYDTPEDAKMLPSPGSINVGLAYQLLAARAVRETGGAGPPRDGDGAVMPDGAGGSGGGVVRPEALRPMAANILDNQSAEGTWRCGVQPPVTPGGETITYLARLALGSLTPDALPRPDALTTPTLAADAWIAAAPESEDNQPRNYRLWLEVAEGRSREQLLPTMDRILARQHPDGGWSQTPEMQPDAFATGQTLYVLALAGLDPGDSAFRRGVRFLQSTQLEDGSWPMTSRLAPGKTPVKNLEPVTYAATAWAAMAVMRSTPGS